MRRYAFPVVLGLAGIAILLSLGFWQLGRLDRKQAILAGIEAKIIAAPVALSTLGLPDPERDRYLPVTTAGHTTGQELLVLSGSQEQGPGYEIITAFQTTEGRRILLDRGLVGEAAKGQARPPVTLAVIGNLAWPNESDSYTPPPDQASNLWFARDVEAMAKSLKTDPVLVVIRSAEGDSQGILPVPVDTAGIPNDHLSYAITWFSLAAVWAGMTGYLLWRIRQKTA